MELKINIDEKELQEMVTRLYAERLVDATGTRELYSFHKTIDKSVREIIYAEKAQIVDRCVERASAEMIRRGMPALTKALLAKGDD